MELIVHSSSYLTTMGDEFWIFILHDWDHYLALCCGGRVYRSETNERTAINEATIVII